MDLKGCFSKLSDEWETPKDLFKDLYSEFHCLKFLVFIAFIISSTYFIDKLFNYLWRKRNG